MLSLNECFGGAEVSLVLTQEGPVDSHSGDRVQGRRRHKIAPQILFRAQCCAMEIAVRERGHPYGAVAHPGSPPAWRNASSRSEIACLSCATAAVFSSILVLLSFVKTVTGLADDFFSACALRAAAATLS